MVTTPDDTALQKGTLTPAQTEQTGSAKAVSLIESLAAGTPSLPTGTTISPQLQNVATTELMATPGVTGTLAAAVPTAPTAPTIATPTAVTGTSAVAPTAQAAAQMTPATVAGQTPTMTAAQGTVSAPMQAAMGTITSDATVKGQLESLQNEVSTALASGNPLPVWARGAAKATEAAMANRGLSASSMANLSNQQQANLQNINTRQTFLLSDQAASNAAFQFNATSQNQVNQFYDKLSTSIADANAGRIDAMKKFAEAEKAKVNALNAQNTIAVNEANAKREDVINRFNSQLENQRQQFNVANQREIDQSNVVWRRAVNTANTAAVNASNQVNAQNVLNLSNWALSSLWQQWRDEASWVNTSSENQNNRNHNLAMAALERSTAFELQDQASKDALYQLIGKFGFDLLGS
jgi:hypothetical protein